MEEEKKVFKVGYKCRNCNKEFEEKYCKGDEIRDNLFWIYVKSHNCTHSPGCEYCRTIICPNCSSRDIMVMDREPL